MDQQIKSEQITQKNNNRIWAIVAAIIITGLVAGVGTYMYFAQQKKSTQKQFQNQISTLQKQLSEYQSQNDKLQQQIENLNTQIELKNDNKTEKSSSEVISNNNTITFYNKTFSFVGDKNKIIPHGLDGPENFFYEGLEVSKTFKGPYAIYSDVDTTKLTFVCDSPLINFNGEDYTGLNRKQVNWQYCETNENDFLTQFEFSAASGIGHATGGEITERWYKLYIKRINDVNYIFIGPLNGDYLDSPNPEMDQEYKDKYLHISSKTYLDEIRKDEDIKAKIEEWDKFVDSFDIVD
ncbi:hypothetical protein HOD96_01600 [Candidatus Falkowbacteria bacterium]|jgi:predicted ribosomally synthesized peptide with SipW-like signal peptide|nr:hypothetical protein [Candidatus Falkowbacteria bacterium]MBT4433428.1 hypothetical protein [Candidatus Falkowbacteria bacterium]